MQKKIAWVFAGLDPCGLAGLANDIKTMSDFDVHVCTICSCMTAQNNHTFINLHKTSSLLLKDQIASLNVNFQPQVIKLGMLSGVKIIKLISKTLSKLQVPTIADPITHTSSGYNLLEKKDLKIYRKYLFSMITVLTPNRFEVEHFLGAKIRNEQDIEKCADYLIEMGVKQVIIKGGHFCNKLASDYWTNGEINCWLSFPKVQNKKVRGTGCAFSSALSACIALGDDILQAFLKTKCYLYEAIKKSYLVESNFFSLGHQPPSITCLPEYNSKGMRSLSKAFLPPGVIGLYPIIDTLAKLEQLSYFNIKTIQLRIKDQESIENTIRRSCIWSKKFGIKLWINDHWELAIKMGAYGVHLGQQDLISADLIAIQQAGLRLGITVHNEFELMQARSMKPSYLAIGPVFLSPTKPNLFPLPIDKLTIWSQLTDIPLVAIGGINLSNVRTLFNKNLKGFAVVSALKENIFSTTINEWLAIEKNFLLSHNK